jgi:hypothetical protein
MDVGKAWLFAAAERVTCDGNIFGGKTTLVRVPVLEYNFFEYILYLQTLNSVMQ